MVDILNIIFGIFIFLVCNQQWHICELYKLQNYNEYPALLPNTDKPQHTYQKVDDDAKGSERPGADHSGRRKREENATHADDDTSQEDPCIPNPCKNSGICQVDRKDSKDFNCVCKLDHRGKLCNGTMPNCTVDCKEIQGCVLSPDGIDICEVVFFNKLSMPSCAVDCQETQDCVLSPNGAVCICVGGFSSKLCKLEHVGLKTLDKLVYDLSNQSTMQVEVFLGCLAFFMLIISLCLIIHCCRVGQKRQTLRDEYKQLIRDGTVPNSLPPDWFDVSNIICKQTCCCKKAKPDVEEKPTGTSVNIQKRSVEDLALREEEFDRLMSQTSKLSVIRNRAPPRLKRHPSSSRSHVPPNHYDATNLNSHATTTSDSNEDLSETCPVESDSDVFGKGVLNKDSYISNARYYCVEKDGVSMIFDNDEYLIPVDKRKHRRKSHREVASGNTNLGLDDYINLPRKPTKGERIYKHELYNEAYDEGVRMMADEDIPLLKRKGDKRRPNHIAQSKRRTHRRGGKRHKYKAYSYSEVPHFLEITCNEANNNSVSNSSGILQQESQSRNICGINKRKNTNTRNHHRFSDISNDQYQSYSLSKSVPADYFQDNCQKCFLNRDRTRSLEPIASHLANTEYSQRIDSADFCENSNTNAYLDNYVTEWNMYYYTVNVEPELCSSQHDNDTAEFSDGEQCPPRQGTKNFTDESTNLFQREPTDACCSCTKPSYSASSLITRANCNSFVVSQGCFTEQPCESTTLLQNDSVSEKRAKVNTHLPCNVLVKENSVKNIDLHTETPIHIETSLIDKADICKKWLQQAEETVANLTSKYLPTGKITESAGGEHDKVEINSSSTSFLTPTSEASCSEDDECTIVASESNTSNCSEITVKAQADDTCNT